MNQLDPDREICRSAELQSLRSAAGMERVGFLPQIITSCGKVEVKNKRVDQALRALRKKIDRDGGLKEARKKQRFEKKSRKKYEKNRRAKHAAKLQAEEDRYWRG